MCLCVCLSCLSQLRVETNLQQELEQKEKEIHRIKAHNLALRQLFHEGDYERHEALISSLEQQAPDMRKIAAAGDSDASPALKHRRCIMAGSVDEELWQTLEDLKAFKPFRAPVG